MAYHINSRTPPLRSAFVDFRFIPQSGTKFEFSTYLFPSGFAFELANFTKLALLSTLHQTKKIYSRKFKLCARLRYTHSSVSLCSRAQWASPRAGILWVNRRYCLLDYLAFRSFIL
ncbi:hypothetical protein SCG7109_AN_00140 [Chlamydiales bacterium SCGC AG-110-M15]|nr:hypothetical protein SCG7109_AN_00140 [Chlamydiales bacterium SCGC AG-110-M15]